MKIKKLDKRHSGYGYFTHMLVIDDRGYWYPWYKLASKLFGYGGDIKRFKKERELFQRWAFSTKRGAVPIIIYVKNEKDLTWLLMNWNE